MAAQAFLSPLACSTRMCIQVAQRNALLAQACILLCAIMRLVQHAMQKGPDLKLNWLGASLMMHTLVCIHACMSCMCTTPFVAASLSAGFAASAQKDSYIGWRASPMNRTTQRLGYPCCAILRKHYCQSWHQNGTTPGTISLQLMSQPILAKWFGGKTTSEAAGSRLSASVLRL